MRLIQGRWLLVDAIHADKEIDSVEVDYRRNRTELFFENGKVDQYMFDMQDTVSWSYMLKGYKLALAKDTIVTRVFLINKLTTDSLILSDSISRLKYIRLDEQE
ncbi:hypothetical protein [Dysgonomonas sp. 511]|uniref:hypothetical protein n=1 Tax=Dysgonomonas sp. 511 TaxID=2302930 RepID=UPI0013D6D1EC|nr:hypothetical protein [Dysgonomonas sp. 511]